MNDEPLVQVRELRRSFGSVQAVQDVSFDLQRGEVLGFLGLNGAGKSTTMAMLAGVLAPSAGQVVIAGHDLAARPLAAKAALGYLPDTPPLYEQHSVREFLTYAAGLRGLGGRRRRAAVNRALDRCGLGAVAARLLGNLSRGFRQRAGIAQAIVHEPRVLILDEPTSGLDPAQLHSIRSLVRELARDHAILFSTHILQEAQAMCDRIQIIHRGRLVHQGTVLQAGTEADGYRVRLLAPPAAEQLETLSSVHTCTANGGGAFRIRLVPHATADALARELVDAGFGLLELTPSTRGLEELFIATTLGEKREDG